MLFKKVFNYITKCLIHQLSSSPHSLKDFPWKIVPTFYEVALAYVLEPNGRYICHLPYQHYNLFFVWGRFCQKVKFKINKNGDFGGFQLQKMKKKNGKNCQIHIFGFHCGVRNINIER
jgi:hypothetical protein